MKNCLVCKKQVEQNEEFCNECIEFFKWKYGNEFKEILDLYKKYYIQNKFSREVKMESYKCSCGAYTTNEDGICDMCESLAMEYEEESDDSSD